MSTAVIGATGRVGSEIVRGLLALECRGGGNDPDWLDELHGDYRLNWDRLSNCVLAVGVREAECLLGSTLQPGSSGDQGTKWRQR